MNLAVQRALDVDAVRVSVQESGDLEVDMSDALGGTMILVRTLVTMVREATGQDDDLIISKARERFDRFCRP